jgi:hypothetical protein
LDKFRREFARRTRRKISAPKKFLPAIALSRVKSRHAVLEKNSAPLAPRDSRADLTLTLPVEIVFRETIRREIAPASSVRRFFPGVRAK